VRESREDCGTSGSSYERASRGTSRECLSLETATA
jgi:hypothetical protein